MISPAFAGLFLCCARAAFLRHTRPLRAASAIFARPF